MRYIFFALSTVLLFSCHSTSEKAVTSNSISILGTTGMVAEIASKVVGDFGEVDALLGPGIDPHLYKPSHNDIVKLRAADVVLYNGLLLEGKMGETLESLRESKTVIAVADGLDRNRLLGSEDYENAYDPHVWFDLELWMDCVEFTTDELVKAYPQQSERFRANSDAYINELSVLHAYCMQSIQSIPANQRSLITSHDAFRYFGRKYGIEVKGLQGISTATEIGLKDITNMVNYITDRGIKAVFVESSTSNKGIEAVMEGCERKGHKVKLGGTLFADAMGAEDSPESNFAGMVRFNVETIINALQ